MQLAFLKPNKSLNKAYLKEKIGRDAIELFKINLTSLVSRINEHESEENLKNVVSDFLKDTWYKGTYEINTKDRKDLVIHTGKTSKESVGVILEVKKPGNKGEMISAAKPNTKALHEMILYYLRETVDQKNTDIKYLIVTNIYEWFIFDELWFLKNVFRNIKLNKDFQNWKLSGKDTRFFYENIAKPFLDTIDERVECTYFDIREYESVISNKNKQDDKKLIALYKILSPEHLLKQRFANDSNTLDTKFYTELLYIIGLEEVKDGGKKLIQRKAKPDHASLLENALLKLKDRESLDNITTLSTYGHTANEQYYTVALELCITWINRILFLKLLEAQLFKYHKGDKHYLFLNTTVIHDFDELSNLFFQVLAEKPINRRKDLQDKFSKVPYLNSSLFDRIVLEKQTIDIGALDNRIPLPLLTTTVLKDENGKRITGNLTTLQYLFAFLNAYDFTSEGSEEIQEDNKNLINASVLGLIFEKINGYKDGSFFTPGFVTMYMCKETIRRAVLQKFNDTKGWNCETIETLYDNISDKKEANTIINSLTICDPAVGSGHFLVSALNEVIAIKSELKILLDRQGKTLRDYEVEVVNDELIVTDENGLLDYSPNHKESQRIQEALFHEKQTIIENCLFGVDINPNSVKICRLRLWIELLKSAYYRTTLSTLNSQRELETLPNIDINIKCGNSLISRFALDVDIKSALRKSKVNIDDYKVAVQTYRDAESKEQKREMEGLIDTIKKDFRSEISVNDSKIKALSKLRGEYANLTQIKELFDDGNKKTKESKKKIEDLNKEISKQEIAIEEIKNNKIYDNAFEWRFEFPEVLNSDGDFVGFDVVIGNPPYGAEFDSQEKNYIKNNYKSYQYKYDSYLYFIELGIKISKIKGVIEYITPILWLSLDNCYPIRSIILKENNLKRIFIHGEGVFNEAVVNTLSFQIEKTVPKNDLLILKDGVASLINKFDLIDEKTLKINFKTSLKDKIIIEKIKSKSNFLSNYGEVIQGITAYDSYQGQSKEIIESKAYHFDFKKDKTCGKWLDGKNLNRYQITWDNKWLQYGDWLAAPREKRFFQGTRILFRESPGKGKRIQACITSEEYFYGHSISPFKPNEKHLNDLQYILGIVNSKLISWFGNYTLANFGKEVFPKLNPNDIKELPVPINGEKHEEITELVNKLTLIQSDLLNNEIMEKEIDALVYALYGLTEEEIGIVEG